jgi:hypothetical protein
MVSREAAISQCGPQNTIASGATFALPQTDAVEDLFTTQVVAAEENPSDAAAHTVTASRSLCLRVTAQDTPTIVGRRLQQEWRVLSKRVDDDLAAGNAEAADRDRRIAEYYRVQAARWCAQFGGETLRPTSR